MFCFCNSAPLMGIGLPVDGFREVPLNNPVLVVIVTFAPSGLEKYLEELLALAEKYPSPKDIRPLIEEIGGKYDQVVLGPSPAAQVEPAH